MDFFLDLNVNVTNFDESCIVRVQSRKNKRIIYDDSSSNDEDDFQNTSTKVSLNLSSGVVNVFNCILLL